MAVNIHIDGITHIAGKYNTVCDSLSRRGLNHPSTVREHAVSLGLAAARLIDIGGDKDVMALLELCRPQGDTQSGEEFIIFWEKARTAVESFIARFPPPTLTLPYT